MIRRITALLAAAIAAALVWGCEKKDDGAKTVGVAVIISHPALDSIRDGVVDELKSTGMKLNFDIQNANGDMNTAASIANKFKYDADISIGIATPIAVALANAIKDKPVVFSTVNDPVSAGLVETMDRGYKNVTGLSDAIPIKTHLEEFVKIYPIKRLGFVYSNSESNAVGMAAQTKAVCEEMGIEFVPAPITNPAEVKQAAESIAGRVDAFYAVTDNTLFSGLNSLLSTAKANRIPVFGADTTAAENGGVLFAIGFDYYKAGRLTGRIAADILKGKKPEDIPVATMKYPENSETLIDLDTAEYLGIAVPENLIKNADMIIKNGKLTKSER